MKSKRSMPRPRAADEPIVFRTLAEMPPMPVSLASTLSAKTGSWRYIRPLYDDKTPPCNHACPAGNDIVRYIAALRSSQVEAAWRILVAENPLPGVCGRVCPHPCERECNRGEFGGAIAIRALERYLADEAAAHGWRPAQPKARRPGRIAIVGAGPAGLSCAFHLARLGYQPTVFEGEAQPGGLLRYGIPAYRLPRAVLDREIANIESLGVRFVLNRRLGDGLDWQELAEMDAVFLALGQPSSRPLGLPGEATAGIVPGLDFLRRVARGERVEPGARVLVIGGGNTAMDAARTAARLGAAVTVVYRRTEAEMPAVAEEIAEARAEGVAFRFLAAPLQALVEGGRLRALRCQEMRLGAPDASGRGRPEPVPGAEFTLAADTIIAAVGQALDERTLAGTGIAIEAGRVVVDSAMQTALAGVFAGGDAATGEGTVAQAVGSGKRAALAIDRYLQTGTLEGLPPPGIAVHACERPASSVVVRPQDLNADYIEVAPRPKLGGRPPGRPQGDFSEVNPGLTAEVAAGEAERCISCGTCIECDTCLVFCPDVAIARAAGGGYTIAYDYCKGCGICAHECPRAAMAMMKEEGQ